MTRELAESERSERSAEHLTGLAAVGAVLLSLVLSALLARSILDPLVRLTAGTREVSAGRFDYRLEATGDDELAQLAREFNSMTERLDELDRMKRDFVSKVSHDLKTPLSSMQETTGALLDEVAGPLTPKQHQLLAINHESGQRLSSMLTKLLDLSRIEAGLEPDLQILDVRQVLRRSVARVSEGAAEGRVLLTVSDAASKLLVLGDPDGLAQVIDNLLDNALKFSPFDGRVNVQLSDLATRGDAVPAERWAALRRRGVIPGAVLITVADEGPGIPDDEKERVFTRFYQTESGRAVRGRGVGLGLTICREIIHAHGGVLWTADNQPRGSRFLILLPGALRVGAESSEPALAAGTERRT
jgi:two-component system sensor histidine kinase GlrK